MDKRREETNTALFEKLTAIEEEINDEKKAEENIVTDIKDDLPIAKIDSQSNDEVIEDTETTLSIDKKETEKNEELKDESATVDNTKSEFDPKHVHYEGDVAIYTDPKSGYKYKWDPDKSEWVSISEHVYGFEDDTHTYTDSDGTKFFWDKDKNAWFPKIDDNFMAHYQLNYGFNNDKNEEPVKETKVTDSPPPPKVEKPQAEKGVKRKPSDPTWFEPDEKQNTKVYVSNLPSDITEEEFTEIMQKWGIIMKDPTNGKLKIKLYSDLSTGEFKGDALCTYIRVESVDLALMMLDGYELRGKKMKIERAKFQMRGEYDPKLKPKSKKRKEKQKLKRMQEQLFDWRPEKQRGERSKHERVVIVKNLFEPSLFDDEVNLILEYQQDLREECAKIGIVRKVVIFDRHPEGVAQITMGEPEEADQCVAMLNGRWFGKRQLSSEIWDGKTKFKIAETDSQITQRIDKWEQFLNGEDAEKTEVEASKS